MPGVFHGEALAMENMAQMGAAGGTEDFRSSAIGIGFSFNGAGHFIIETRPPAMGFKLILRAVEWRFTPSTTIDSLNLVVQQGAGKRTFSTFVNDNIFFFWS